MVEIKGLTLQHRVHSSTLHFISPSIFPNNLLVFLKKVFTNEQNQSLRKCIYRDFRRAEAGREGGTPEVDFLPPEARLVSFTPSLFCFPMLDLGRGEGDNGGSLLSAK